MKQNAPRTYWFVTLLTPFLFAFGVLVGFMNTPLFPAPVPVPVEDDLMPVNRELMRLLVGERNVKETKI